MQQVNLVAWHKLKYAESDSKLLLALFCVGVSQKLFYNW